MELEEEEGEEDEEEKEEDRKKGRGEDNYVRRGGNEKEVEEAKEKE